MAITNEQLYTLMMRIFERQHRLSFDEYAPTAVTVQAGTVVGGDYTSLAQQDSSYLEINEVDADPGLRVDVAFSPPVGSTLFSVIVIGRYDHDPAHHMDVLAYNYDTDSYDDISSTLSGTIQHQNDNDLLYEYSLTSDHIDTDGSVLIRLDHYPSLGTNGGVLYLDKMCLCVLGGEHGDQAKPGDKMDLIDAPNTTALTAIGDSIGERVNVSAGLSQDDLLYTLINNAWLNAGFAAESYVSSEGLDGSQADVLDVSFSGDLGTGSINVFSTNFDPSAATSSTLLGTLTGSPIQTWTKDPTWNNVITGLSPILIQIAPNTGEVIDAGVLTITVNRSIFGPIPRTYTIDTYRVSEGGAGYNLWLYVDKYGKSVVQGSGVVDITSYFDANITKIDGNPTNDNTATLALRSISLIDSTNGTPLQIQSSGAAAVSILSTTSDGIMIEAASNAISIESTNIGNGIKIVSNVGDCINISAPTGQSGIKIVGANGIDITTDNIGIGVVSNTGNALYIEGSLNSVYLGSFTTGSGIKIVTVDGHGINIEHQGVGKKAIYAPDSELGMTKGITNISYNGDGTMNVITFSDGTTLTFGYSVGRKVTATYG